MTIREYTKEDTESWVGLRKELWPDASADIHSIEIRLVTEHPERTTVILLIDEHGNARGFAELSIRDRVDGALSDRVGYLEGWYVQEAFRGKGWGKKLIARAEEWVRSKDLTELASDAELGNDQSIAAHHALGFRETFRVVQFIKRV